MQNEIKKQIRLLNEEGNIANPGFAKKMLYQYHREDIKAAGIKIKEWDYYYFGNEDYGVALTIADNSYMSLVSASFLNFKVVHEKTTSVMKFFTFGKLKLPSTSTFGDTTYEDKDVIMRFSNDGKRRKLYCDFKKFDKEKTLHVEAELFDEPEESMVIATPFDKPKHFYFNQKINCFGVDAKVRYGNDSYTFTKDDTFGVLDWGRGVWTYKNTWYWGSMSCKVDGKQLGFNLGYGFGNTSAASENVIFYDSKIHKLDLVTFEIPQVNGKDDFLSQWKIQDNEGRLNILFTPIIDRFSDTDIGIIRSCQNQVFGRMSGFCKLDDGTYVEFKDKPAFAEKVFNKW